MSQTASVWVVLLVALVAANLPFFNDRLFGVVPLPTIPKSLAVRLAELVVLYFLAGGHRLMASPLAMPSA